MDLNVNPDDRELEQKVLELFECPVCYTHIYPPILQCATGHIVCASCLERLDMCPECRSPKGVITRAYLLEAIYSMLTFPCKHAIEGCKFTAKGYFVKIHENCCYHAPWRCIFQHYGTCNWQGPRDSITGHLTQAHRNQTFFDPEQSFFTHKAHLRERFTFPIIVVFYVFDKLFRAHWEFDRHEDKMKLVVHCLERNVKDDQFSYELCILKKNTNMEVISMKTTCWYLPNETLKFDGTNSVSVNAIQNGIFGRYCDDDGNLNYKVRIFRNDLDSVTESISSANHKPIMVPFYESGTMLYENDEVEPEQRH